MKIGKKITHRIVLLLGCVLVALFLGLGLAGCAYPDPEGDIIENGYVHLVTYDANGGKFGTNENAREVETVRVTDNSLTLEPGTAGKDILPPPVNPGYDLEGWFLVQDNGQGETLTPWNFSRDRVKGNITLRANWAVFKTLSVKATVGNEEVTLASLSFSSRYTVLEQLYTANGVRVQDVKSNLREQKVGEKDYTLLNFYTDKELNNAVTADNLPVEDNKTFTVYAELLEGKYEILTSQTTRLSLNSDSHWYLCEDVNLARGTSKTDINVIDEFRGHIIGNGHTISGIRFRSKVVPNEVGPEQVDRSIFGDVTGTIENVTFKDVTLNVYASRYVAVNPDLTLMIAFLANQVKEGGKVVYVELENCNIDIVNARREEDLSQKVYGYEVADTPVNIITGGEQINIKGSVAFDTDRYDRSER